MPPKSSGNSYSENKPHNVQEKHFHKQIIKLIDLHVDRQKGHFMAENY